MARAPYDTTADLILGPGVPGAGTVYRTIDCRFVPQTQIGYEGLPLALSSVWITFDPPGAHTPDFTFAVGGWSCDVTRADDVAVPSGAVPEWWVCEMAAVFAPGQPVYVRVSLAPLPRP